MLRIFRIIAFWEAVSAVILFFIAMPIKYVFKGMLNIPDDIANGFSTIVGGIHGGLFTIFILMLLVCWQTYNWSIIRVLKYAVLSVFPVVSFWIEKDVKKELELNKENK